MERADLRGNHAGTRSGKQCDRAGRSQTNLPELRLDGRAEVANGLGVPSLVISGAGKDLDTSTTAT